MARLARENKKHRCPTSARFWQMWVFALTVSETYSSGNGGSGGAPGGGAITSKRFMNTPPIT